jgi:RNA polymerase sigma factor (sigma-70 family)
MPEAANRRYRRWPYRIPDELDRGRRATPASNRPFSMTTRLQESDCSFESLMQAVQGGDAQAYVHLLKEITPRLQRMVRQQRRFLAAADIDDIVQEILISLHAVRATYDPRRPFMPWLMAIARNRLADSGRRHARQSAHEVLVDELPVTFPDEGTNIVDIYGDPEALRRAIKALPSGQRKAVEMVKLREMSMKEAAAVSGTSIGALKVSVHRAMTTLRKALTKSDSRAD